jgi:hypothetical protein
LPYKEHQVADKSLKDMANGRLSRRDAFKMQEHYTIVAEIGTRLSMSGMIVF